MIIRKIHTPDASIEAIARQMADAATGLETLTVGTVDWPEEFPYRPDVTVRLAHNGRELLIQYTVSEAHTAARVTADNGRVWTDSCCECFLAFDDSGYYNLETTCIGKALFAFRQTRENPTYGSPEVMQSIRRHSTLGTEPFDERSGDNRYTLTIALPASAFFRHELKDLSGVEARINVYKCGDELSVPHFVSLFPIDWPKPNFHLPQFFGEAKFE
jgi:hypothetical protein